MNFHNLAFWFLFLYPFATPVPDGKPPIFKNNPVAANLVFKSTDGGQTWQNISEGLPWPEDGFQRNSFFANDSGLFLRAGIGIYHNKPNSKTPAWNKEIFPNKHGNIAAGQSGVLAYNYGGQFLQKAKGSMLWSRVYTNFQHTGVNTFFETTGGTVLVGTNYGLFRSADKGKTWKQIAVEDWVMKLIESNGVLLATSGRGILRSADDGESWDRVLYEGGVGIDVATIKGGFAAIAANTQVQARTVRASYDGGKTWQPIDAGLSPDLRTSSIVQLGDAFFCGHPDGIFKSTDKGKTWKLLFASVDGKVFNLFVSGKVLYAIPVSGGC